MARTDMVSHYTSFLKARDKTQRSIGKYLVHAALNHIDVVHGSITSISDSDFKVKGLDISVLSAISLCRAPRDERAAAIAAIRARWPEAR